MKYKKYIIETICQNLRKGKTRISSVRKAGIDYQTFLDWLDGKIPKNAFKNCKSKSDIKKKKNEFSELIKKAEIEGIATRKGRAEDGLLSSMNKNWTACAWYLERKFPDEYGQTNKHEIDDKRQPVKETSTLLPPINHANNPSYNEAMDPAGRPTKKVPRVDRR